MEYVNETTGDIDLVGAIMDYETGELDMVGTLVLFAHLIKTGMAWTLQGSYGRAAASLIEAGAISPEGEVDWSVVEEW